MRRTILLAALAAALPAAIARSGDAVPPTPPSSRPDAAEPLSVGGSLTDDILVRPLGATAEDPPVPLTTSGQPTVVLFWSARCPVCRRYGSVVKALGKDYEGRARLVVLFPNATESEIDARAWLDAEGVACQAALDARREAASRLAAYVTPTALVFDAGGVLRYRGPVDDDRRARRRDTVDHLRAALDAVLAGKPVENPEPRAFGSSVRRAKAERR